MFSAVRRQVQSTARRSFATSAAAQEHFLQATPEIFAAKALNAPPGRVVLVDFYADWCGPCKVLTPILKTVVDLHSTVDLVTIDTDAFNALAGEYKIAALPTVMAFRDGKQIGKFVGARNAAGVKEFLGSL